MRGSVYPLRCCDRDCAAANGCRVGGIQCSVCGLYYCGEDIASDGFANRICDGCLEELASEDETDEEVEG